MMVVLWSDALLFGLSICVLVYAGYARRREHLRAPWRRVVRSPMAMASAVVLGAYLAVALLDSVHWHPRLPTTGDEAAVYSPDVISAFDWLATPLRESVEKSYSAPFATHLYTMETVDSPSGRPIRSFPRLAFGGAHLTDPTRDRAPDLLRRVALALAAGATLWVAGTVALLGWLARRARESWRTVAGRIARGATDTPWRSILITAGALLLFASLVVNIGGAYHLLGTDKVGQDVLYQTLKSVRTGLLIGTLATLVMLPFAVTLGIAAGYFRGWIDDIVQYIYTTLNAIPGVLLIAAAILTMQVYMAQHAGRFESVVERADLRLLSLCLILGVTSWTGLARLLRGEVLKLREADYIQAAVAFGVSPVRILYRHILPNVMHIVLITVVLDFSVLVLAEAVLSYINIGVDPSTLSWGNMINGARLEMAREPVVWWSLVAALVFMFGLVLAANLFADAVRDAFDPRVRAGR